MRSHEVWNIYTSKDVKMYIKVYRFWFCLSLSTLEKTAFSHCRHWNMNSKKHSIYLASFCNCPIPIPYTIDLLCLKLKIHWKKHTRIRFYFYCIRINFVNYQQTSGSNNLQYRYNNNWRRIYYLGLSYIHLGHMQDLHGEFNIRNKTRHHNRYIQEIGQA